MLSADDLCLLKFTYKVSEEFKLLFFLASMSLEWTADIKGETISFLILMLEEGTIIL